MVVVSVTGNIVKFKVVFKIGHHTDKKKKFVCRVGIISKYSHHNSDSTRYH